MASPTPPFARTPWMPDLCRLPRIAAGLGVAQGVVVVLALAPRADDAWTLAEFGAASLFALWLALLVAVALCKAREWIDRLPRWLGLVVAVSLPVAVAALGAAIVYRIDVGLGTGLSLPYGEGLRFVSSIALLAGLISGAALRYFYMREQWQAQLQAQAKAQVEALQARIRPHFLFNSMNTIASLVRSDPATAERAVEDLADLFRAALGAGEGDATLRQVLALCERYLSIEGLRLGDRLRVQWDLVEPLPLELRMPRLLLQPLVENAIVHGVARMPEGGTVGIRCAADADALQVAIRNPCLPQRERDTGNRHAQDSVARRLAYHFGPRATLTRAYVDGYYVCELTLPLRDGGAAPRSPAP
jgi:two-component system sensor histidine kinase AlgZ